jgi:hypothetical protein
MKKSLADVLGWAVRYVPNGPLYIFPGREPPGRTHEFSELIALVPLDEDTADRTMLDNEHKAP